MELTLDTESPISTITELIKLLNITETTNLNITELSDVLNITELSNLLNITELPTLWSVTEQPNLLNTTTNEIYNLTTENFTNITNSPGPPAYQKYFFMAIAVEMALSCLCLVFSIAVYAILPEFKNVHGKNLISMSVCLLVTFLLLIFDLLARNVVSRSLCFNVAIIIHVTFLANFFWTNVMAFDIWKSLTDMKAKGEVKSSSTKYLKYCTYAWAATVLTAIAAVVLDLTDWLPVRYRPQFGAKRCWLNGPRAFYVYFNLPVGLILLSNFCLFLMTLRKLVLIKRMTAVLNVRQQQKRLYLYMKLFLLMGITWATEFIPLLTGVRFMYIIAGMLTALHGVFLFAIFVCKKKILVNFYQTLRSKDRKSSTATPSTSQQTVSSSSNKKIYIDKLSDSRF